MKQNIFIGICIILFSTTSCVNNQLESKDYFDFTYLELDNEKFDDSTLIKYLFYFDKLSYERCDNYLNDIKSFKERRLSHDDTLDFGKSVLRMLEDNAGRNDAEWILTPKRLKTIRQNYEIKREIDSSFYKGLTLNQLNYFVELNYDELNRVHEIRDEYNDINTIIQFQYNYDFPLYFLKNEFYLNVDFVNVSKYEIDYFKGHIFITNLNNENLAYLSVDSRNFNWDNRRLRLGTGNSISLDNWALSTSIRFNKSEYDHIELTDYEIYRKNENQRTYGYELRYDYNEFIKNQILNSKKIRLIFIPNEIKLNNGRVIM